MLELHYMLLLRFYKNIKITNGYAVFVAIGKLRAANWRGKDLLQLDFSGGQRRKASV